jgi:hypothetical protein
MLKRALAIGTLAIAGCSSHPPPDFAPDPALVARITEIQILPAAQIACPGQVLGAGYEAVLDDGSRIPFSREYDDDAPPALHVVFLDRWSAQAESNRDGHWELTRDPLLSAMDGFELNVQLRQRPDLRASAVVAPEYSCLPHALRFRGPTAAAGVSGGPGPDVLLRIRQLSSPYYERLLVLGVEVGEAPPFFILQDADRIPPADWFDVASIGGEGGRGQEGEQGGVGVDGRDGCPGGRGGTGGTGGPGGQGAMGGSGGPITIIVDREMPYLAGLVQGRSLGGPGGPGGRGGTGGTGGEGGRGIVVSGRECEDGPKGERGKRGPEGPDGPVGAPGNPPRVIQVSADDVFGLRVPPGLQSLVDFSR